LSRYKRELVDSENLASAWRKAKRLFLNGDTLIDYGAVAAFELNLKEELESLASDFDSGHYNLQKLIHIPQPKKPDDSGPRLRQFFHVAVRDQVAWIALANVIGPILDSKMPKWSYGNRLYKAAWYEDIDGESRLEFGPYRHSSGQLYRKFQHSWPLFRRHVSLTARMMSGGIQENQILDDPDQAALMYSERPEYLNFGYWGGEHGQRLHYASIDLERFYPTIRGAAIIRALRSHLDGFSKDIWLQKLVERLLGFRVGREGSCHLGDPLVQPVTRLGRYEGIPTGLMVAGFLSNVAMLPLDDSVESSLSRARTVAHFRFVDDHAILASSFDELVSWVRLYKSELDRLQIGPVISETKYEPAKLATVVDGSADEGTLKAVRKETELDGTRPVKLMTKTLTLVSELAGADFDILPEQSREQRLGELEWLLLSTLPDTEIRGDTRVAFAAGRIAKLVPITFSPSPELLDAWRELSRLKSHRDDDMAGHKAALETASSVLRVRAKGDLERYDRLVGHYFRLLFQAFCDHPERPRLFLRLLGYCRSTGYAGTAEVLNWIVGECDGPNKSTAEFLASLALQALSLNIAAATFDVGDKRLLGRERLSARSYLISLGSPASQNALRRILNSARERHCCDASSLAALKAAVACAAAVTAKRTQGAVIEKRMRGLAELLGAPSFQSSSEEWAASTGRPIGAWVHFIEMMQRPSKIRIAWRAAAASHDPHEPLDWSNLRKHPAELPPHASEFLREPPARRLEENDAGWLLDHHHALSAPADADLFTGRAGAALQRYRRERARWEGCPSLMEWTSMISALPATDPRASEWTALEILRLLVQKVTTFGAGSLQDLDELHPANILLDSGWLREPTETEAIEEGQWTWETWTRHVRSLALPQVVHSKINDYRRHPERFSSGEAGQDWQYQLRGCGLLLLGLITKDFSLPSSWNVRGLERNVGGFVRERLEESVISSRSQSIIEAATLPRSFETARIRSAPWAFFGARDVSAVTDTRTDPPLIDDPQDLMGAIVKAQRTLERNQITVLNHAPRQLVPMNIIQLTGTAVEMPEPELEP
jgi:hypothetical protein